MADTPHQGLAGNPDTIQARPPGATPEISGLSLKKQLLRPRSLISFVIAFALVLWVFLRQDVSLSEVWANVQRTDPLLYGIGFLCYYATFFVRATRWKLVLHNAVYNENHDTTLASTPKLARMIFLSWFANSILPAKLGDGYRGYLLKRASGVSFYKTMGTILAERIADVGVLFSLLLASGLIAFRNRAPEDFGLLIAFGAALAVLSVSALFLLRYMGPLITRLLPARARPLYRRLEEGALLAYRERVGTILLLTCAVWLLESARFWFVLASLDVYLNPAVVLFIALAAALLTTVPITPAGLGVVEGAVVTALLWVISDNGLANSIALLDRVITFWSILLLGAITYALSSNK